MYTFGAKVRIKNKTTKKIRHFCVDMKEKQCNFAF